VQAELDPVELDPEPEPAVDVELPDVVEPLPAVVLDEAAGGAADDDTDDAEHPAVRAATASSGMASSLLFTKTPVMY
jgi:hypothetical protein